MSVQWLTTESLRNWRLNWLSSLNELGDYELLRESWLDHTNTNPHYSYVEFVCSYFDDLTLKESDGGYQAWVDRGAVSEQEVKAVEEFHELFDAYEEPGGDIWAMEVILDDPAWKKVAAAASDAREKLMPMLQDEREREVLAGFHRWWEQRHG